MPTMIDTGSYSAQIAQLENENRQLTAASAGAAARDSAMATAEAALAAARRHYSENHPDVIAARERLKFARDNGRFGAEWRRSASSRSRSRRTTKRSGAPCPARCGWSRANARMAGQARAPAIMEQASQLEDRASALREQYKRSPTIC